jgi:molecular chaperone GrpE
MKQKKTEKPKETKGAEPHAAEAEELRLQIEQLQQEKAELFAKLQRVSADYANFQKRASKQIADTIAYEKERIIKTLLPALDNFEHTLASAASAETVDVLVKGIAIAYDQVLDILKSHDVEQIEALGEKFDPVLHQAMMQRYEPDEAEGIVLEEFQKGYKLNGRAIRPSRVVVNKRPLEQPEEAEAAEQGEEAQEQKNNETEGDEEQ